MDWTCKLSWGSQVQKVVYHEEGEDRVCGRCHTLGLRLVGTVGHTVLPPQPVMGCCSLRQVTACTGHVCGPHSAVCPELGGFTSLKGMASARPVWLSG